MIMLTFKGKRGSIKTWIEMNPSIEEGETTFVHGKMGDSTDMFAKEDGEFPKENREPQSNGIGGGNRSEKSSDRQPDVMDDHAGKSRFTFIFSSNLNSLCLSILPVLVFD